MSLKPGDIVLLSTDGIEETMSPDNLMFGSERMLDVVRANHTKSSSEIVQCLYNAVREFSKNTPQIDDVTTIVIKVR